MSGVGEGFTSFLVEDKYDAGLQYYFHLMESFSSEECAQYAPAGFYVSQKDVFTHSFQPLGYSTHICKIVN